MHCIGHPFRPALRAFPGRLRISSAKPDAVAAGRGNDFKVSAFLSSHPVTDERLKALEKQIPSRQGEPLLSQEQWRALKEICKTT